MGVVRAFARRLTEPFEAAPEPPKDEKAAPGGICYFMDENEATVLYQMPWPYVGAPNCPRTNTSVWTIEDRRFVPARRQGTHWIYRRCADSSSPRSRSS